MAKREAQYRGYKIEIQRNSAEWTVWVRPLTPELPIMQKTSFRTVVPDEGKAIAEAVQRIDQLLLK